MSPAMTPTFEQLEDIRKADGLPGYAVVLEKGIPPSDQAERDRGKQLFRSSCAGCHGEEGRGDGEVGKSLDPPPRDLHQVAQYKYGHLELSLFRTIGYGVPDTGMAGWGEVLEPDEVWADLPLRQP